MTSAGVASAGEARSLTALFLSAKALEVALQALELAGGDRAAADLQPGELQGAVETLIELVQHRAAPRDHDQVASAAISALAEYYRRQHPPTVVDEEKMDERDYRAPE